MLKIILIVVAVIAVVFVVAVALQPSEFRVSRTALIAAPAPVVFAQVNDLHQWDAWSPWAKLDPAAKQAHEGPPAGTGASFTWAGNKNVGEGRMTIVESHPSERIRLQLVFFKPLPGTSLVDFAFKPEGGQTAVTWTMTGRNDFMAKCVGLFMNCEKMVGGQFEQGLAQLKTVTEAASRDQTVESVSAN
jgi:hypothetical protein